MKTTKILLAAALVITGSMIATTGYSQVYVNAHFGFGVRAPRVIITRPAPIVYQDQYAAPAPVYQDEYATPAPVCQDGYSTPATVVYENEFPGYAYYSYPAWNGHYRDRFYFAHYRPYFEREHVGYFNRGRFDHERFEHERFNGRYADRGHNDRGGWDHHRH
ncbi:MAG TPA: hypothetical protein VE035_12360 [Puia sp.]|nr:hypothetical protein [Puia sp.]